MGITFPVCRQVFWTSWTSQSPSRFSPSGQVASADMLRIAVLPTEPGIAAARWEALCGSEFGVGPMSFSDLIYPRIRFLEDVLACRHVRRGAARLKYITILSNHTSRAKRAFLYVGDSHDLPWSNITCAIPIL